MKTLPLPTTRTTSPSRSTQTKFSVWSFPCLVQLLDSKLNFFPLTFCQDLIRSISDPEHRSMTLEQLAVVSVPQVTVAPSRVLIEFTPTVPHCGMSTLIGLSIRVRLLRALPTRFKVDIRVKPGSHQSEHAGSCGFFMPRWLR